MSITVSSIKATLSLDDSQYRAGLRESVTQAQGAAREQAAAFTAGARAAEQAARERQRFIAQVIRQEEQVEREAQRVISQARREAAREAMQAAREIDRANAEMARNAERHAAQVKRAFSSIGQGLSSGAGSALSGLENIFTGLARGAENLAQALLRDVAGALQAVAVVGERAGLVLAGTVLAGMIAIGKAGVDMNTSIQRATLALTKIGGPEGPKLIADARKEALTSALTFRQLIPIVQQVTAAYGPGGLGRVIPTIRAFGDAAATLGVDPAAQERALLGFRQLISAAPNARDLRQIGENLPGSNPQDIIKRAFGTTDSKALQEAGVTGAMMADAIIKGFQEQFGGAQAQLAKVDIGIILSNFADAFNNLSQAVTQRFTPALAAGLSRVLETVSRLSESPQFIAALSVPFELLGVAIGKAADALPGFVKWLEGIATRENVIALLAGIAGAIQTIWQETMKLIGAVTGGNSLASIWEGFQKAARTAIELVYKGIVGLGAGIEYLVQHAPQLWQAFADAAKPALHVLDTLIGLVTVLTATKVVGLPGLIGALLFGGKGGTSVQAGMFGGGAGGSWDESAPGGSSAGLPEGVYSKGDPRIRGFHPVSLKPKIPHDIPGLIGMLLSGLGIGGPSGGVEGLGELLADIGERVRGGVTGAAGAGLNALPDSLKNFVGGGIKAVTDAAAKANLDSVFDAQKRNAATLAAAATAALASPAGAAAGGGLPSAPQLYHGGGAASAAMAVAPERALTDKQVKEFQQSFQAFVEAKLARVKAESAASGEELRAAQEASILVPGLQVKQKELSDLAASMKPYTAEWYRLQKEYYQAQEQIGNLQHRAAVEASSAAKKSQEEAKKALDAAREASRYQMEGFDLSLKFREAQLKDLPGVSAQQKKQALLPILADKFRFLQSATGGEDTDPNARTHRLLDMQEILNQIREALGGMGARQTQIALGQLGLGAMPKLSLGEQMMQRRQALLDSIQARRQRFVGRGAPQDPFAALMQPLQDAMQPHNLPGRGAAGGGLTIVVPLTVVTQDPRDPKVRRRIHDEVDARLDELSRGQNPGPSRIK